MKKLLSLVALSLPTAIWAVGLGTSRDPFIINSTDDLVQFRDAVNSGESSFNGLDLSQGGAGLYFKLGASLDLSSAKNPDVGGWEPIGNDEHPFRGHFDGGSKVIDSLQLDLSSAPSSYKFQKGYGLFGVVESADQDSVMISNVKLGSGTYISVNDEASVGGVVGFAKGKVQVSNCTNSAKLVSGRYNTAGIVGEVSEGTDVKILENENNGSINSGYAYAAGIVAQVSGSTIVISECFNKASVQGGYWAAGIVGKMDASKSGSKLQNCKNFGSLSSGKSTAGIVINSKNVSLFNLYNGAKVQASMMASGIADTVSAMSSVTLCVNAGEIFAGSYAAGVVFEDLSTSLTYDQNLNLGKVEGMQIAGGIVGIVRAAGKALEMTNNMNAGHVYGYYAGGLVGRLQTGSSRLDGNLTVGTTDTTDMDGSYMGAVVGYKTEDVEQTGISYYDSLMNPIGATGNSEYKDFLVGMVSADLTDGTLPKSMSSSAWVAKRGYYPQLKNLASNSFVEIQNASALAATPIMMQKGDHAWSVSHFSYPTKTANDSAIQVSGGSQFTIKDGNASAKNKSAAALVLKSAGLSKEMYLSSEVKNVYAGTGSRKDPLVITSLEDFIKFRDAILDSSEYRGVKMDNAGKGLWFRLDVDLDLSSVCGKVKGSWKAIHPFSGNFDGNGHVIRHLYMDDVDEGSSENVGLFGNLFAGKDSLTIQNLELDSATINFTKSSARGGAIATAAITGSVILKNLKVKHLNYAVNGKKAGVATTSSYVGGIIGNTVASLLSLDSNSVAGSIKISSESGSVGGIMGAAPNKTFLRNNENHADISATNSRVDLGGIVGQAASSMQIVDNTNDGKIKGDTLLDYSYVGGIIGVNPYSPGDNLIARNVNHGKIIASSEMTVVVGGVSGMLTGSVKGMISKDVNYGDIAVTSLGQGSHAMVGGVAGSFRVLFADSLVNEGSITIKNITYSSVGGVAGVSDNVTGTVTMSGCVNKGDVKIQNDNEKDDSWEVSAAGLLGDADKAEEVVLNGVGGTEGSIYVGGMAKLRKAKVSSLVYADESITVSKEKTVSDKISLDVKDVTPYDEQSMDPLMMVKRVNEQNAFRVHHSTKGWTVEFLGTAAPRVFDLRGRKVKMQK